MFCTVHFAKECFMEYNSIYLSRKELKRFLKIANGSTAASNTPEEHALFQKSLVTKQTVVNINQFTRSYSVDPHAVVLTDYGKDYYALHMNHRKERRQESFRYLITTLISLLATLTGIITTIAAIQ